MASLEEAFGCSFSETPFEIIDDNFKIDNTDDIKQPLIRQQPLQQAPQQQTPQPRQSVQNDCVHISTCSVCRNKLTKDETTNILLLVIIGLLLFIILEKRLLK